MAGRAGRLWLLAVLLLVAAAAAKKKTVKKQLQDELGEAEEVETPLGVVRGRWMRTRGGRHVSAFTGLPYAQPPTGDLRFKAPVPADKWDGVRESPPLEAVPVCEQPEDGLTIQGLPRSEDCLFLNVFTPRATNGSNLPVLVYIHGGGFVEGSATTYGPEYLLDRDVVLVTLNYRLGALGFLSTGDEASTGNWGLKDQQLALRWLHQHIALFGGDPEKVTLFGHSSGGASVHYHIMARSNSGLFHRAMSMGGTAISHGLPLSGSRARTLADKLAGAVGCPTSNSSDLVSCLRAKPARDLVGHEAVLKAGGLCPLVTWGPVVEDFVPEEARRDAFLEQHPADALSNGLALEVPWMAGMNLNEGGLWAAAIHASKQVEAFDSNFEQLAPLCFGYHDTAAEADLGEITQEIRDFYFSTSNITVESLNDLAKLFTDGVVLSALDEAMRLHASYTPAPAYLYLFSHRGQRSLTDLHAKLGQAGSSGRGGPNDLGVVHADELLQLFPWTHVVPIKSGDSKDATDRKVSELFIDLLMNFAKDGNPTPAKDTRYPTPWKPVENEDLEFVEIAPGGRLLTGTGLLGYRAHFWSALPLSDRHIKNMLASIPLARHDEF